MSSETRSCSVSSFLIFLQGPGSRWKIGRDEALNVIFNLALKSTRRSDRTFSIDR